MGPLWPGTQRRTKTPCGKISYAPRVRLQYPAGAPRGEWRRPESVLVLEPFDCSVPSWAIAIEPAIETNAVPVGQILALAIRNPVFGDKKSPG